MTKAEKIAAYDPNGVGATGQGIFGLPFTPEESDVVFIPVPWEVTVSYMSGAARGPEAVLLASPQLDLYLPDAPDAWKVGFAMLDIPSEIKEQSDLHRHKAWELITFLEEGGNIEETEDGADLLREVNGACEKMNAWVQKTTEEWLSKGKTVVLVGGDHSTPLGYLRSLAQRHASFGILQIDAHPDLRDAYEGFVYSHASITFNALKIEQVSQVVQVGLRDYCQAEAELIANSNGKITGFYDADLKRRQFKGESWEAICNDIVAQLPEKVYITFDIDGLDPKLCPNTGTPVPGGLEFDQAMYLIEKVVETGRTIIGSDLVEVAPGENDWDGNVGARVLWQLAVATARSQKVFK